jgi:hypothetical protein
MAKNEFGKIVQQRLQRISNGEKKEINPTSSLPPVITEGFKVSSLKRETGLALNEADINVIELTPADLEQSERTFEVAEVNAPLTSVVRRMFDNLSTPPKNYLVRRYTMPLEVKNTLLKRRYQSGELEIKEWTDRLPGFGLAHFEIIDTLPNTDKSEKPDHNLLSNNQPIPLDSVERRDIGQKRIIIRALVKSGVALVTGAQELLEEKKVA